MGRFSRRIFVPACLTFIPLLVLIVLRGTPIMTSGMTSRGIPAVNWPRILKLIRNDTHDCRTLLRSKTSGDFVLSEEYLEMSAQFSHHLSEVRRELNFPTLAPHSGDLVHQSRVYHFLASLDFVSIICEIGFNAGHSTLQFLSAKPTNKVYSFDIGQHVYVKQMAAYFQHKYPDRFTIIWGDSRNTVPRFFIHNQDVKCDIMLIDGGFEEDTAKRDLENLRWLANPDHHVIIVNGHPATVLPSIREAWDGELVLGGVRQMVTCSYLPGRERGFTLGNYVFEMKKPK